ncbi:MAG: hypothetical protein EOR25_29955 [Mesorhizobium sp.]|uniref:hypothetical protein n=1 Tax=Mesorhizobium sp. TaxID=1871066 RepID=UPI000FE3F22F|nr:hypothetical protein [Mesorhizobium sp.]RWJ04874.1 MAG: hypothetical protein EOR24_29855 [Mesorhizobium sp.]RWJ11929.1 MAG: hypothetical protein EOR25_29955 [Mesorhizobium sp.]
MFKVVSGLLSLLVCTGAFAQQARHGWSFQLHQTPADGVIFPVSSIAEEGPDTGRRATIFVVCSPYGDLMSFFDPGNAKMEGAVSIEFRDGDETKGFTFAEGVVPYLGHRLKLAPDLARELLDIFLRADGQDVPFAMGSKAGVFSSSGAAEMFQRVQRSCPVKDATPNFH